MRYRAAALVVLGVLAGPARPVTAQIVPAPGWAVRTIPTPDVVQGSVARQGSHVLVGQGATFSAGAQSIIRLEDEAVPVVIATGFNSLGGFHLDAAGTLLVTDNGLEAPGDPAAATGDTLYAVPDALTRTTALAAVDAEVLPPGSIPSAQDVLRAPDGAALVTDAAGVGAGRVVRVENGTSSDLVTGLDFLGGIARAADDTLHLTNVDGSFQGNVLRYTLAGAPLAPLAGGLSGAFDVVIDPVGDALVSGGFTDDFSSSTVVALAPDGTPTERARGFGFSVEMFHDPTRDELLVLDFGVTEIAAICRDADGDAVCDADDPCVGTGVVGEPVLKLGRLGLPAGDERVVFKGTLTGVAGIDPISTGARLVVENGGGPVVSAVIPPGAFDPATGRGWRVRRRKWRYTDPTGMAAGIVKVVVTTRRSGDLRFGVVGTRGTYPVDPDALPLAGTFALDPAAGACGASLFTAEACTTRRAGTVVRCR